jgi:uncharacterized protein YodC (DUF2158 family)
MHSRCSLLPSALDLDFFESCPILGMPIWALQEQGRDMDFKAGDVVNLKSGGLAMTIVWVKDGAAWCEWFDSESKPQGRKFSLVVLKHFN